MNKTEIFICECNSPEHQFIIDADEDNVYLTPYLSPYLGFFRRCVLAVKYIFGYRSRHGSFDSVVLSRSRVKQLIGSLRNLSIDKNE
jgi:hypothetical protein